MSASTVLGLVALGLAAAAVQLWRGKNRERFRGDVDRAALAMWIGDGGGAPPPVDRVWLAGLPAAVQRYATRVLSDDHASARGVRLRQRGSFRTSLDGRWLRLAGDEYLSAAPPGFVWWGRIRLVPGVSFDALDRSVEGRGSMFVRVASVFTAVNASSEGIHQGALVRCLAELVWLPAALFDRRYITWEPVDDRRARATVRVGGREASVTFHFGENGLPVEVSAMRDFDLGGGKTVLRPWSVDLEDYRAVEWGMLVPFTAQVHWHVEGKRIPVGTFHVDTLELDRLEPFA